MSEQEIKLGDNWWKGTLPESEQYCRLTCDAKKIGEHAPWWYRGPGSPRFEGV